MCHVCVEIDKTIRTYEKIKDRGVSSETERSISILVIELERRKVALHSDPKPGEF